MLDDVFTSPWQSPCCGGARAGLELSCLRRSVKGRLQLKVRPRRAPVWRWVSRCWPEGRCDPAKES
jgi:hypothetical protein